MNTSIGTIVTVDEVCQAAAATLEAQLPGVLASITDDRTIQPPTSYQQVPAREAILASEKNLPAIGVFSDGLASEPVRDENGVYEKTWRITVAFYDRANSFENTQWKVRTAGALIQAILAQNQTLGGITARVIPVAETYDVLDWQASRTLAGVAVDVDVVVQSAFTDTPLNLNNPDDLVLTTSTDVEVLHPALA